jgi:hypothetical protein
MSDRTPLETIRELRAEVSSLESQLKQAQEREGIQYAGVLKLESRLQAVTEAARKLCDKVAIQHEEASTMDARVELQALLVEGK